MPVRPAADRGADQVRPVRVHGKNFPVAVAIGGKQEPLITVNKGNVRIALVVALLVVLVAVGEVDGRGPVGIGHVDVPVSVPVAGEHKPAAARRPGGVFISRGVVADVDWGGFLIAINRELKSVDLGVAVTV